MSRDTVVGILSSTVPSERPLLNNLLDLTARGDRDGKKTIDRRIPRTGSMLQHALNSLILKKGYEAITIKDICNAANVGRSTFYAHYRSKDDLKRSRFEPLRRNRRQEFRGRWFRAKFVVQYVVGAFMAVLTWWLDRRAKLRPRPIDAMFRLLASDGITASHS
jgi:AcrR family transcriptional regulator